MANLITSVESINTQEYELLVKPMMDDPQVQALPFMFQFGNMPREIHYNANNLDKITGAKTACGWNNKGDGIAFDKKTLTPIEVDASVKQCYTVFLKKLFGDKLPEGHKRGELYPELINLIIKQQLYAFNRDLLSMITLGDTGATPDDYYSLIDGIYTKLVAGAAAVDGTVDANVSLTSTTLNTTNFFGTMNSIYNLQSRALKRLAKTEKIWIWTQSVYDLYLNYLEVTTQNTAGAMQTQYVVDGLTATHFKGIPITVLGIVDERLEEDFLSGSPAEPTDPYRVILTTPSNHIFLMDGSGYVSADPVYLPANDEVLVPSTALIAYEYGFGELNLYSGF